MFCDLRPGIRRNVLAAGWFGGGFGGFSSVLAAGIATKKALIIGAMTVMGPALATGLTIASLTVLGYAAAYRSAVGSARKEIETALDAMEAGIHSDDLFGELPTKQISRERESR